MDEVIQYIAERELDKVVKNYRPKGASIIVMNPYTGEILAMAKDIREDRVVISTFVDGFTNLNEADNYVTEDDFDGFDDADEDESHSDSQALTKQLEELKAQALERFDQIANLFEVLHQVYDMEIS